tara:strand:+ start:807 stop:1574 length:768 start_codon:yes stop_codon:yes gene_type:complete
MAFKMKGKSPMMKALIGKQHNLPPELKAKIEASPMKKGGEYGKRHDKLIAKGRKAQDDAMDAFDAGKTRKTNRLDKKAAKKFGKARDIRTKKNSSSAMKTGDHSDATGHKHGISKNLKKKTEYDPRVETREEVMKANALEDKNNDAAAKRAYDKMMAKKAKSKAKAKDTPMKKGKKGSHAHGSVSGEKGSKERRLKETRAKLINKQHAKKKGTLGNAVRKSRVKRINRKLKADGTFYSGKDSKTKSVRDGGRIEF